MAWTLITSKIIPRGKVLFCYGNKPIIGQLVQSPDIFEDEKGNKYPNIKYWKEIETLPEEIIKDELLKIAIEKEKSLLIALLYKTTQKINEAGFFESNESERLELMGALEKICGDIHE